MPESDAVRSRRLLFSSYHGYVDPSSGAAISVRELLRQLAVRGWEIRTYCGPLLDFAGGEDVRQVLADEHVAFREAKSRTGGHGFTLISFADGPIRSTVFVPDDGGDHQPGEEVASVFLDGFGRAIDRWCPDVLLTYRGNGTAAPMFREARRRGIRVVFWLHNFGYTNERLFESVDRTIVPSRFSAEHYRVNLGLTADVLPYALDWDRVVCERSAGPGYVTFVNPQPHKGVFVVARIAEQLQQRRPDIPLLIVEGRAGVEWLERTGLDLRGSSNLHVMKNTPDARDFYRVSRIVLMPSLWRESFGRVAAEAMINGIPVLASSRGALPEVVGDAGFLFDVPERYTPESRIVPSAEEVAPWVDTIIRLRDDRQFHEEANGRCRERVEAWRAEKVLARYEDVFDGLIARG